MNKMDKLLFDLTVEIIKITYMMPEYLEINNQEDLLNFIKPIKALEEAISSNLNVILKESEDRTNEYGREIFNYAWEKFKEQLNVVISRDKMMNNEVREVIEGIKKRLS